MGNRAVIITESADMGLYLHWDGSPEQVQAFLSFCHLMGYRSPDLDYYGWAQMAKIIGNFIDRNRRSEGLSLGLFSIHFSDHSPKNQPENPPEISSGALSDTVSSVSPALIDAISPGDNGVYIIRRWQIIRHIPSEEVDEPISPDLLLMLLEDINECQPCHLPKEELEAYVRNNEAHYAPSSLAC